MSELDNVTGTFWMDNISILYKDGNYTKFVPTYNSTREDQLNAITRFCLYFIILSLIFNTGENFLYLPITIITLTILFNYVDKLDPKKKNKRVQKILDNRQKKINEAEMVLSQEKKQDGSGKNNFINDDQEVNDNDTTYGTSTETSNIEVPNVEAGYYDSSGNLIIGKEYKANNIVNNNNNIYTHEEMKKYNDATCRKPTRDNPFMNPTITDYNVDDPPQACNADDEDIKDEIKMNFNKDLYRNVEDLWEKKNSQRQFYTLPTTSVPNDQDGFAKWLYKSPYTCKEDNMQCLKYDDVRYKL